MRRIRIAGGPEYGCAEDDTLLRGALRAGLGLPYECNTGSCGTCKVELIEGDVESLRPDAPGLTERDRAKKRILACQAHPLGDCTIKARLDPEAVPAHAPVKFSARLAGWRDLTHDMREFRFATVGAPGFLPGQYAIFYLPGLPAPRTYSMANIENDAGEWRFIVRRVPGGTGTHALFDSVPIGREITLDGPYGIAYLRTKSPRDIVCIGGGSGLAPMLSIARGAVHERELDGRRIRVFYGARTPRDLCGADDLNELPGYGERLTFEQVISTPGAEGAGGWDGPTGFVHEHVRRVLGERLPEFEVYFAGPPAMAEAVQKMLAECKVPYGQIHFDSFY